MEKGKDTHGCLLNSNQYNYAVEKWFVSNQNQIRIIVSGKCKTSGNSSANGHDFHDSVLQVFVRLPSLHKIKYISFNMESISYHIPE